MSIVATLKILSRSKAFVELCKHDVFREILEHAPEHNEMAHANVTSLLIDENIYRFKYVTPANIDELLSAYGGIDILSEEQLELSELGNILGKWRLNFLRYLKAVSLATLELVQVTYEHERGDTPYEEATWTCDPESPKNEIETFSLSSFDGTNPAEWTKIAIRYSDGSIEVSDADIFR